MAIQKIKDSLGEHAKDAKINLGNLLKVENTPGLNQTQVYGIAYSSALTVRDSELAEAILEEAKNDLNDQEVHASKLAVSLMGMNNVYYRFLHLTKDGEFKKLPAKLRMQGLQNPGVEKLNFEAYALAVSVINACDMCVDAHVNTLKKAGLDHEGIQSIVRIASVIHATSFR